MNRFEIVTPADLPAAVRLLAQPGHMALAGGVDTLDLLKQQIAAPRTLVDLNGLKELQGIDPTPDGGLRVGALARLSDVAAHPVVRARFAALAEAAGEAATPQIRNLGTVGGNLLQRPRCWYFRNPDIVCLKKGGHLCYAINGLNRYHAILGGGPSFIVHPSNLAPALIAFGASVRLFGPGGERKVVLDQFFALPSVDATRENVLQAGEIVVEVDCAAARGVGRERLPRSAREAELRLAAGERRGDAGDRSGLEEGPSGERGARRGGADSVARARGRAGARGRRARSRSCGECGRRGAQGCAPATP